MKGSDIIKTCLEESFGKCLAAGWSRGWMLLALVTVVGIAGWLVWSYLGGTKKALEDRGKRDADLLLAGIERSDIRRRYLELFIEDHRYFKFRGLDAQARGVATPEVDQAFVSLRVLPDIVPEEPDRSESAGREAHRLDREPVEPLDLAGAIQGSAKLAIIGAAGCGKSTLLQWAGLAAARDGLGEPLQDGARRFLDALGFARLMPILISLAAFNRYCKEQRCDPTPDTFLRFLTVSTHDAHPTLGITREFFESELRRGCLLMLDGLDEVDPGDRERIREALEGLLREFRDSAQNHYLLTARTVAYRGRAEVADFRKCTVQPLMPDQRNALVRAWYAAVHPKNPDEARRRADDLCARIDRSAEQVKALAVTPLMVTIFALVHFDQRELPRQRAELYEHSVRVLLTERFKPEDVVEALKKWGGMEWQTRRDHLARIAFELHKLREGGEAVPEDDLVGLAWPSFGTDERSARDLARDFVRAAADRGGLLEETGRRYGFLTHRTFREFLAGRYLAEELRPEARRDFLAAHLGDDHWEEPSRLAAGYLAIQGQSRANDFVTTNGIPFLGFRVYPTHRRLKRPQRRPLRAPAARPSPRDGSRRDPAGGGECGRTRVAQPRRSRGHVWPPPRCARACRSRRVNESPIFSRTYDFLLWLLPQATKLPRAYRFTLAERVQERALDFQETLIAAGLAAGAERSQWLRRADTQLAQLRQALRLCHDLSLLTLRQYEHAAERLTEIGRLLGGWRRTLGKTGPADGARRRVEQQSQELPRRLPEQERPDELQ